MGSITGEKISGIFPSFVVAQQLCIINFCYNIIIWKISFKLIIKSLLSVFVSSHTNFYSQECESRNVTFPCLVQLYKQIFSQTLFISRNLDCMFPPLSIPISKGRNPIIFSCLPLLILLLHHRRWTPIHWLNCDTGEQSYTGHCCFFHCKCKRFFAFDIGEIGWE